MAVLKATFRAIDEMSAMLDNIARRGENAVDTLEEAGRAASGAFDTATASAGTASSALDNYERETQEAASSLDSLSDASRDAENALDQQARAAENAADEVESFGEESEGAGEEARRFGTASVDSIQELSKALTAAGIAKAIHAIYEEFANAVGAAIEFESAVTGVYKTVDGSSEQLQQISRDIKDMSTVMPSSANDIAAVAEAAGQLGIATDDVTSFTEVMINLGEATNLSADEAASSLAKFTNITSMAATDYENLGSTVVALGNNFATTEADIVAMSTRLASAGTMAGLTEPQILALATAMSSVGIEADAGGSAMSKLLTDMQVAVETGSDRLEEFASVAGMTGDAFADSFGKNAVDALYAFISGLNDTERNGATATVVLENMGITEVRLSNAVKSLANNSEGLNSAITVANTAWQENTALTNEVGLRYGTLASRISMAENSSENLAAAIGDDLTPIVGTFIDTKRGFTDWLTDIVEKHPAVTAGLTAVSIAVGIVAAAVTVFALVTSPIVVGAINAITTAMMANPVFLIITGVVALTAAVVAFVAVLSSQKSEYDTWTASTKNQYDELQQLNAEYETACEQYGETSDEALELRYQVDELTSSFEASKKSVEQFSAECDKLLDSHQKLVSSYNENIETIKSEEIGSMALVRQLESLSSETALTIAEQLKMATIVDALNEKIPGLALAYDKETGALNSTAEAVRELAKARIEQKRLEEQSGTYVKALENQAALTEKIAEAEANLTAERERRGMYYDEVLQQWTNGAYTEDSLWASWTTDLDEYSDALNALQAAEEENNRIIEETEAAYDAQAKAIENAKNEHRTYEEAVSTALSSVQEEMGKLAEKYDEAYESARENINGVISLFDTMKTETSLSIADMTSAMESQVAYLDRYTENLRKASEYGLDNGLISSLSDGSAESAGQLDAIIGKIESLGSTSADAAKFVSDFNDSFSEVQTAKDEFAATVADMQTDFSAKMDEMEKKLTESIDNMNMETEAATAAKDTMTAYINSIKAQQASAVSAAEAVAKATSDALSRTATVPSRGYAVGTTSAAPGLALVGEEGPELVNFGGGEVVYTAPETERILSDTANRDFNIPVPENLMAESGPPENRSTEKKIVLDINGSGEIDVKGSDEETVWGMVAPKLKSAFMGIIRQEIFEEGDLAYEF